MIDSVTLIKDKRKDILRIAARYGARNVRIFGSIVRGEAREDSDFDFIVWSLGAVSLILAVC
jgi:predicted nucleotidyltransferase